MPRLVRLYIIQVFIGFGLSAVFVALLLWQNVGNLAHLVTNSDMGWLALLMLFVFNGLIFAGVQFAIVIMRMADTPEPPSRGKKLPLNSQMVPVKVVAGPPKRDRRGT